MMKTCALVALSAASASAALFTENFGEGWEGRWTTSSAKEGLGAFESADSGIKTSEDAKFYGLLAEFDEFSNTDKDLYVQFTVKHEQNIDCGGGYVKIFPKQDDLAATDMESYNVMFGPDICGPGTRKTHVIMAYDGEHQENTKSIACKYDEASHLYQLRLSKDNTYEVQIDGAKEEGGSLYEDFNFLKAKEIEDPDVSKPEDWVDETQINDPEDAKPDDWVTEKEIVDPEAEQPEDWDEEMDGEWEAPTIDNPDFKGDWSAKQIENPAYKGEWVHPLIANPEYVHTTPSTTTRRSVPSALTCGRSSPAPSSTRSSSPTTRPRPPPVSRRSTLWSKPRRPPRRSPTKRRLLRRPLPRRRPRPPPPTPKRPPTTKRRRRRLPTRSLPRTSFKHRGPQPTPPTTPTTTTTSCRKASLLALVLQETGPFFVSTPRRGMVSLEPEGQSASQENKPDCLRTFWRDGATCNRGTPSHGSLAVPNDCYLLSGEGNPPPPICELLYPLSAFSHLFHFDYICLPR